MSVDGAFWIFLADPSEYGWEELVRDGETVWDGVGNATAQKHLRSCTVDDSVLIYHTAPDKAVVGIARISGEPEPENEDSKRVVVCLEAVQALQRPLALDELREDPLLRELGAVRMPRVAVHPVTREQWDRVLELTRTDPGSAADVDPAMAGGP